LLVAEQLRDLLGCEYAGCLMPLLAELQIPAIPVADLYGHASLEEHGHSIALLAVTGFDDMGLI
jgi:hypothetical protein